MDGVIAKFKAFDRNGDGTCSWDEFSPVLMKFGMDEDEVLQLFNNADANHDGRIDYGEFLRWIAGTAEPAVLKIWSLAGSEIAVLPCASLLWKLQDILSALEKQYPLPDEKEYTLICCDVIMAADRTLLDYGLMWRHTDGPMQADIQAVVNAKVKPEDGETKRRGYFEEGPRNVLVLSPTGRSVACLEATDASLHMWTKSDVMSRLEAAVEPLDGERYKLFCNFTLFRSGQTLEECGCEWEVLGRPRKIPYDAQSLFIKVVAVLLPDDFEVERAKEALQAASMACNCVKDIQVSHLKLLTKVKEDPPPIVHPILAAFCDLLGEPMMKSRWERSMNLVQDKTLARRLSDFDKDKEDIVAHHRWCIKVLVPVLSIPEFNVQLPRPWSALNPLRAWFATLDHYCNLALVHKFRMIALHGYR